MQLPLEVIPDRAVENFSVFIRVYRQPCQATGQVEYFQIAFAIAMKSIPGYLAIVDASDIVACQFRIYRLQTT